jgi:phosphonate transport system substrate-binding protein
MSKVMIILLLGALLAACASQSAVPVAGFVDLDNLQPLPTSAEQDVRPLRVAIAAVISPQGSAESYAPLLDYLSDKLNRPVERVQRRTYAEVNELLRTGEVDLAFVCTSSYLLGKREFGLELLAAPQVNGETTYRASLIVPADSADVRIEDLRGKVFAFTDPNSFTGRVYPTYLLQQIGETPEGFFARTFFTYSHDDAIRAVANGVADGASVDSLVLDFALKRQPDLFDEPLKASKGSSNLAKRLRVIHVSPPFGMPPVVVNPSIRPQLRAELEAILLEMHEDPAGLSALQALGYDRFVQVSDEDYRSAEEVESQVILSEVELSNGVRDPSAARGEGNP